jgi:hypothetical protein
VLATIDARWFDAGSGRSVVMLVALAVLAIAALLVAAGAYQRGQNRHRRGADDDSDLFTTTPLPMANDKGARGKEIPAHHAYGTFRLPRWVQLGSLVVACGITYVAWERLRTDDGTRAARQEAARAAESQAAANRADADDDSPENLDFARDASAPFAFRARDWVPASGGCAGRLEVTRGAPAAWSLQARVHDDQGKLLDTAMARVATLREGDVVEFRFARAACERIGAWDVRGARRTP